MIWASAYGYMDSFFLPSIWLKDFYNLGAYYIGLKMC